jgi:hypothetical protein
MLIQRVIVSFAFLAFAMTTQAGDTGIGSCAIQTEIEADLPADTSKAPTVNHKCARVKKGNKLNVKQAGGGRLFMIFTKGTPFDGKYVLRMNQEYTATEDGTFPYMVIDTTPNNKRPAYDPVIVVDP